MTYELDGPHVPEPQQLIIGHDPPNQAMVMETPLGEFRSIRGDVTVSCSQQDGAWQRLDLASGAPEGFDHPTENVLPWRDVQRAVDASFEPRSAFSETIAGRPASCFDLELDPELFEPPAKPQQPSG